MDDEVRLGYQAAVVSVGSPLYGRHWLAVKPHPGNLVSCLLAEELVLAWKPARACGPGGGLSCSANAGRPSASR